MAYKLDIKRTDNADKFREPAITFQKTGRYTSAPVGTTEYRRYWDEQYRRSLFGFTADDGEYITGYFYFYLNFCPILLTKKEQKKDGTGRSRTVVVRTKDFPRFYDYDRAYFDAVEEAENEGKHLVVIKKRGAGYSFKGGSMLCRNFYLIPDSKSFAIASEAEFLTKDGLLTKAWDFMDFLDQHTAWSKKRQKIDTKMHKRASIVIDKDGVKTEVGYKSEIMGITLKNDAQKARGKRAKLILWEEGGKFPNLKTAWQIARPSVEDSNVAFGLMIAYGTGGTDGADYEGLKDLFYEPDGYNCLPIVNQWDEENYGKSCGFFVPEYYNMTGEYDGDLKEFTGLPFMDEHGNSNLNLSKRYSLEVRKKIFDSATDKTAIDRYVCEHPFTPAEATLNIKGNIFPKADLIRHLATIRNSTKLKEFKQVGELVHDATSKQITWQINDRLKDHTKYRLEPGINKNGAVVIWEHPCENPPYGLYIAGCLLPGEKVLTNEGLLNVEDVTLENKLVNKEGEVVDINTLLRYNKKNENIYKVHMSNVDRPTIYTQEHPLYVSETIDGEFDFLEVKKVKIGMWNKYPNFYNKTKELPLCLWDKHKSKTRSGINNPMLNEDFWWFIGHWLGDGFNNKQGYNYTIYNSFGLNEGEYVYKYKDIVSRLFQRNPNLKLQNGSNTHKFECKQLYLFLEENFGKYANRKYISEWVKFIPENLKLHLILGYLDSDGTVYRDRTMIRGTFKSINRKLLNDIQDILFSIGIVSSFNLSNLESTYSIKGKTGQTKTSYTLRLSQTELKKITDKFGCDCKSRKLKLAKQIELKQKPRVSDKCIISENNKYIYIKIKEIEESSYTGIVYNFDCETHSFVTQYCTGHNCDPYDHDESGTNSLGSVIIYKRFQNFESYYDLPVAEYTGRPESAEDFYEIVRRLIKYYNAKLLYENEKKGLYVYFSHKNEEYLLADQPDVINDILQHKTIVNRKKGIHMNKEIKLWGERLIKDWLNEEYAPGQKNLNKIFSEPLLEELISYNTDGNFDRVMALMMIMIYKQELYHVQVSKKKDYDKSRSFFAEPLFKDLEGIGWI